MIALKAVAMEPGTKGFDSYAPVTDAILKAAWEDGCRFVVRYVHNINDAEIECIIRNGFGFMLVTYANNWNGDDAINVAKAHGYPQGATLWLDVEGVAVIVADEVKAINLWSIVVKTFYIPGMYAGAGQFLTWQQMTQLVTQNYWESCSLVVDANGNPSRPATNWNMTQVAPGNLHKYGTVVDIDYTRQDTRARTPWMAVAA